MSTQKTNFGGRWGGRIDPTKTINPVVTGPSYKSTGPLPAKFTPHGGTNNPRRTYTGDKIVGIGTMHKSNMVPVFSAQEAEDIAKMRRG